MGRDRTPPSPPIGCRWVDINKGDEDNPEYRSRLVAKEIKKDRNQDLFAATPPLEAKRLLFSMFAHQRRKRGPLLEMSFCDITKA